MIRLRASATPLSGLRIHDRQAALFELMFQQRQQLRLRVNMIGIGAELRTAKELEVLRVEFLIARSCRRVRQRRGAPESATRHCRRHVLVHRKDRMANEGTLRAGLDTVHVQQCTVNSIGPVVLRRMERGGLNCGRRTVSGGLVEKRMSKWGDTCRPPALASRISCAISRNAFRSNRWEEQRRS